MFIISHITGFFIVFSFSKQVYYTELRASAHLLLKKNKNKKKNIYGRYVKYAFVSSTLSFDEINLEI